MDKLDWLNKHFVLIRYVQVAEAAEKENYRLRPDLVELADGVTVAEDLAFRFAKHEKFREACELMVYIAHQRAGVWWVYRCVNTLVEELKENPAVDRDIADIAANFTPAVPDFAKIEIPEVDAALKAQADAALANARAKVKAARKKADPEVLALLENAVEIAFQRFKEVHGIHPIDLLKKVGARVGENRNAIDPASPIFKAADEIKAQIQAARLETVDLIKSVIPPKVPEHEKKLRDNALAAVYRWIVAPDEPNSKACLDMGNECSDTPAGLLALSSFWAFGNLMPGGDQIVPTPPGLASNGLAQTLLMCALHKGGTRKPKERYELYFNLGVDVLSGKDNWDESLVTGKAPHETAGAPPAGPNGNGSNDNVSGGNDNAGGGNGNDSNDNAGGSNDNVSGGNDNGNGSAGGSGYKRWKPGNPGT
jgi:hypothetical protein